MKAVRVWTRGHGVLEYDTYDEYVEARERAAYFARLTECNKPLADAELAAWRERRNSRIRVRDAQRSAESSTA